MNEQREIVWSVAALFAFVAVRVVLLAVREPFYDELFTQWLVRHSFGGIVDALRHDSGPPLYYFLLKTLHIDSVTGARVVSLTCATLSAAILLGAKKLGSSRFAAVLLLAVYAPSVLLSTDARAYALCSLFLTIGIVAIVYERAFLAACAFVLAAYSHYYGVFFFATLPRWRAAVLACALFVPGFLLARVQPVEAMQWLTSFRENPLANLSFAGLYPASLFQTAPLLLVLIALGLLVVAVAREWRFARFTLIPIALVILIGLAVRPVYFPMRFESIIAVPLALWLAQSSRRWTLAALGVIGAYVAIAGIIEHGQRPLDSYRVAALTAREHVPSSMPVVASGYLYLESVAALGERVTAFPHEQRSHPGWRATLSPDVLRTQTSALPKQFVWIGERGAPELPILCASFDCRVRFANQRAVIVEMRAKT